jgi:hypothetical protein
MRHLRLKIAGSEVNGHTFALTRGKSTWLSCELGENTTPVAALPIIAYLHGVEAGVVMQSEPSLGSEFLSCEFIEGGIMFERDRLMACCISVPNGKGRVELCEYNGGPIPAKKSKTVPSARTSCVEQPLDFSVSMRGVP